MACHKLRCVLHYFARMLRTHPAPPRAHPPSPGHAGVHGGGAGRGGGVGAEAGWEAEAGVRFVRRVLGEGGVDWRKSDAMIRNAR